MAQQFRVFVVFIFQIGTESHRGFFGEAFFDDIFKIRESSAADEKDVIGVDGLHRSHRIFLVGTYRNFHGGALQQL